jgi:hypothetical protein
LGNDLRLLLKKFDMKLHREGFVIMAVGLTILSVIQWGNYLLFTATGWLWLFLLLSLGGLVMAYLIIQFFRVPNRICAFSDTDIMCPADGKIVVIEEVEETEYFKVANECACELQSYFRNCEICKISPGIIFGCLAS